MNTARVRTAALSALLGLLVAGLFGVLAMLAPPAQADTGPDSVECRHSQDLLNVAVRVHTDLLDKVDDLVADIGLANGVLDKAHANEHRALIALRIATGNRDRDCRRVEHRRPSRSSSPSSSTPATSTPESSTPASTKPQVFPRPKGSADTGAL